MRYRRWTFALIPALLLALSPGAAEAQTGSVVGTVVSGTDQRPVEGAQVQIVGTNRGMLTNQQGRFLITNVPVGTQQVRVVHIGYSAAAQEVNVTAGATATVNFELQESAVQLEALLVAATGRQTQKREIGSSVGNLAVEDLDLTPINDIGQLLQGRISGVSVIGAGGTAGTGSRIRIRGSNSVSLNNSPLLVIDGVRVNDNSGSYTLFTGGQETSRLNDLNPEDIESIEVLRGPSAAALYGTAAANGVIQVTTKRGRAGDSRWQAWAEGSVSDRNITFPDNYWAEASTGGTTCGIAAQAAGTCTVGTLHTFNPLENDDTTPFRTGWGQTYGVSVSGGDETVTYYLSGEYQEDVGTQVENDHEQVNLRANVSGEVRDNLRISARVGYANANTQLPQNDNSGLGVVLNGVLGVPTPARVEQRQGYRIPREALFGWDNFQDLQRFTASATMDWQPVEWLTVTGVGGIDDTDRHDNDIVPPGPLAIFGSPFAEGFRESWNYNIANYTGSGDATAEFSLTPDVTSTTSAGVQYFQEITDLIETIGTALAPGTGSLNGATPNAVGEANVENITLGTYVSQRLAWKNRLFFNAAVRGDKNSAFGTDLEWIWYPSFSGSWVMSEEDFFPSGETFTTLRLRAAWGQSGLRPQFRDALRFFSPISAASQASVEPGFVITGAGNPNLEPQRSTEWEVGFEAGLLSDRVGLDFTYYNKDSEKDIISRPLPPSAGSASSRNENLGLMTNKGIEWDLRIDAVRSPGFDWTVSLLGSYNDNELEDLADQPEIPFGILGSTQIHKEGLAAGAYYQKPILGWDDADGNGILSESEVQVGDEETFIGQVFPKTELGISTSVGIGDWLTVSALADYKGGHHLLNLTEWDRCDIGSCRTVNDPTSVSLEEQARYVAWTKGETVAGYMEEADYWKLREISATFRLPSDMAQRVLRGEAASITFAGRNLATFTDYSGFDPEVLSGGTGANFSTWDGHALPPFRSFSLRVNVTY